MNWIHFLWIALGGAAGSVLRAGISTAFPVARLPWGTLLVNVSGALIIGWLMGRFGGPAAENARLHSLMVAGFCGGFTTFSAFSWQVFDYFQKGEAVTALLLITLSVVLCLAATWLGWRVAQ